MFESVLLLTNTEVDLGSEAKELVGLPSPEQVLQDLAPRPPYGQIAVGAMRRLDHLLQCAEVAEQLPAASIVLGEQSLGPSSEVAYKMLMTNLAYYALYCIEHLDEQDGESLTDALGMAMRPRMFEVDVGDSLFLFAQGVRHAITVCAGAYWLRSFSKLSEQPALQYHFLRPIAKSASILLNLTGLSDPILNWGIMILSRFAGKVLFECTEIMEENLPGSLLTGYRVNTSRLVRLAKKEPSLQKSLGARMYTEFEKELKLLFQSFGCFVSHTRPGKRRVDLVVAAPPPCPYVFLVEAKCYQSVYSLPTSDERALREYIGAYQQSSHTLSTLRFVLITSSKPASTLERKLVRLSASEGIPVRFVSAQNLAYLRDHLSGLVHPKLLLDSTISAGPILGKRWAESIVGSTKHREQIFDLAVQSIFGESTTELFSYPQTEK
jgi:hypothetical protein